MHRHLFAPILPFVTLLISISIHIPSTSSADDQYYTNCLNSYECGDITITYPFWGAENRPVYCGYPGFEITCQSDVLTITISSITYRVLAIDKSTRTLTVARQDYWENYCPTYLINTILDPHIFSYSSTSRNLTLYYGCPSSISAPSISNQQYSCKINETDVVGYYMTRDLTESELAAANSLGTCKDSVKVPIFGSAIETLNKSPSLENLHEAIVGGFGLKWAADNSLCEGCDQSGGQCGRNVGSGEFICYCAAGPYVSRCGYGKDSKNASLTIGLAVAGAAIAAGIVICFLFFCVRQRRKKQVNQSNQSKGLPTPSSSNGLPTPTSNFSRTTPTYFSSSQSNDIERGSMYFGVQVFTYNELEEATDNFDPSRELGDGGFGVVYYGKLHDGRVVAVKRLYEKSFKRVEQFINEVEILARLRHPNLVTLYGCTSKRSPKLILVYEYIPNGTVADHLHGDRANSGSLTWPVRLSIAIETAGALTYLHRSDIIHRDVKTNNILLDNEFRVKVADFGLSRLFPTDVTHVSTAPQGTPGYVDPEYHQSYQLTDRSDVYSFGVVLVELITSLQAVDITRHRHDINLANMAINKIQSDTLHELVDPCLGFETDSDVRRMTTMVAELAFRCLQQDRDLRPSMEEVLETLKVIEKDEFNTPKPEVVDIRSDHVGLLKNMPLPPPFSPESVVSAKWTSSSTAASSF